MKKECFNGEWLFHSGIGTALEKTIQGETATVKMTLPHDAMIRQQRDEHAPAGNASGYYPYTSACYTKTFTVEDVSETLCLEFEGIYKNASVYLNGSLIAQHANGYTPLLTEISQYVRQGSNSLKVLVRNSVPSSRWYSGTGIYRDVWLYRGKDVSIVPHGVKVTVLHADRESAELSVSTEIANRLKSRVSVQLAHRIENEEIRTTVTMNPDETKTVELRFHIKNPRLWSTESPSLYECQTELCGYDAETVCFGIRTLSLDPFRGLRINGKEIKLRGGCIHQDHGIIGGIEHEAMTYRRIRKLKEAGYNAIRCAHFPTSRTVLDACDALGMLVMLELCDAWTVPKVEGDYSCEFRNDWKQDTEDMVKLAYNHPSVIIYSIGNEILEVSDPHEVQYGRKICDLIRSLDRTRYTTNSINIILAMLDKIPELAAKKGVDINSILNGNMEELYKVLMSDEMEEPLEEAFSQTDIAGYNYAEFRYETDLENYPQRIILGTECYPGALFENWQLCLKHPQIIGDFGWTAWDYLGEAGVGQHRYGESDKNDLYGRYPWRSAGCGDFDLIGNRRPVSYWRQTVWGLRKEPYIAVQDPAHYGEKQAPTKWGWSDGERRWNYRGQEGNPVTVEVYSDAEEVELFINDRRVGKEKTVHDKAFFTAVYEPGTLRAVNIRNGQPAETDELVSASYDVHVEQMETSEGIIEFAVMDDSGILNPDVTVNLTVSEENNPELLGLGSADPKSDENYFERTVKTWQGRAMAVIRGTGKLRIEVKDETAECN
ncbi:MAG: DUF4982 domain-containing protein [Solobacterium sp.]|nr:DUF4982 domain-containing protein [Solobacterium sp.]